MLRRSAVFALAMLLVLATAPGAIAKPHGTDRPITVDVSGEINWTFDPIPGCAVQTVSDARGQATHLGRMTMHSVHCPPMGPGEVYHNGTMTLTAANGDALTGTYDINGEPPYSFDIDGGTGRFSGATGRLALSYEITWAPWDEVNNVPIAPWSANWHYSGTISY